MCNVWRTLSMAYFLKKTKRNDRLYLSIYESFYSPETKNTRHKSFRKIGFVDALIEQGIDDPISHFQKEVNELNSKRETEKVSHQLSTDFRHFTRTMSGLCTNCENLEHAGCKRTFWVFKLFKEIRVRCI